MAEPAKGTPVLEIRGLNVFYGASHALQGVDLTLMSGALSVVGRNGMGKTTLCKAIIGLQKAASGSIRFQGREISALDPAAIARLGISYVPQGRRLWPSLTVDEHLRLTQAGRRGSWSPERVYDTFPRLAERRSNRGNQLSGGEQQMLAISRALLMDPKLLVMDEPTEGLAPVIVQQVEELLVRLAAEGDLSVLIIEQNIGVATTVAETTAIMVNGRVNRTMQSSALAADRELQQRLLGVGRPGADDGQHLDPASATGAAEAAADARKQPGPYRIFVSNPSIPTRWSQPVAIDRIEAAARTVTPVTSRATSMPAHPDLHPLSPGGEPVVLVAGTFDTKGNELRFMAAALREHGHRTRLVDLSTSGKPSACDVPPHQVAAHHRRGAAGVFSANQQASMVAMGEAFENWIRRQSAIAGILAAGGSHGTMAVAPGMRALPLGVPKLLVSTEASGDVARIVGTADIMLLHSVSDVGGLNIVSRQVLANGAEAMAGMVSARESALKGARRGSPGRPELPAVGIAFDARTETLATTIGALLVDAFEIIPFKGEAGLHSMRKLADSGRVAAIVELSAAGFAEGMLAGTAGTHEVQPYLQTGRVPTVVVPGNADGVQYTRKEAMPAAFSGRPQIDLLSGGVLARQDGRQMADLGSRIAADLNRRDCALRFVFPQAGLSLEGARGGRFHDEAADEALIRAVEANLVQTANRRIVRSPYAIGDLPFAQELADLIRSLVGARARTKRTLVS